MSGTALRRWCFVGRKELGTVGAIDKSRARAAFKERLGIPKRGRLPAGAQIQELGARSASRLPRQSA